MKCTIRSRAHAALGQSPRVAERLRLARFAYVGIAGAVALTACAPHPRVATIYCVSPQQYERLKSAEPPKVGNRLTGQAQDDLKLIAGSAIELREYSHGLLQVLGGCVDPNGASK